MLYHRVPRLFVLLALGRGDGRYAKLIRQLGRVDLLILDDWGPEPLLPEQQRDLLEIVEDRYNAGSLIITSQLPVDRWYELVGNPTLADAILDRIVHNAYRLELSGESLREAACARAIGKGVHSSDAIINILARQRDPGPAATILTPDTLRLRHAPLADCARYDQLRSTSQWSEPKSSV